MYIKEQMLAHSWDVEILSIIFFFVMIGLFRLYCLNKDKFIIIAMLSCLYLKKVQVGLFFQHAYDI